MTVKRSKPAAEFALLDGDDNPVPYREDYDPDAAAKKPAPKAAKAEAPAAAGKADAPKATGRYYVCLNAATPLAHQKLVVEAGDAESARRAYCRANGISGSELTWKIEETDLPPGPVED